MILPTKHIPPDRSLIAIGAELLRIVRKPMTVSAIWEAFKGSAGRSGVGYDWFVLALDLLFMLGAIEHAKGLVHPVQRR